MKSRAETLIVGKYFLFQVEQLIIAKQQPIKNILTIIRL